MPLINLNQTTDLEALEVKAKELEAKAERAQREAELRKRIVKAKERIKASGSSQSLLVGWGMGKTMIALLAFVVVVLLIVNAC